MASIGNMHLGGINDEGILFQSGVCFFLNQKSEYSKKIDFSEGTWEVEISKGQNSIVARYKHRLSDEQVLVEGHKFAQMFLDLLCVLKNETLYIKNSSNNHLLFYEKKNGYTLKERATHQISFMHESQAFIVGEDGELIEQPLYNNEVNWSPSLRFFRLSQISKDQYEAYRNLFLAIESLFNQIAPKGRSEGEGQWLKRVLELVEGQVDISSCVPRDSSLTPVNYFLTKQYKEIRCKLFHAKRMNILPYDDVSPIIVYEAYLNLLVWWKRISSSYNNLPDIGGGVTNDGFNLIMNNAFAEGFTFEVSDDTAPYNSANKSMSSEWSVIQFTDNNYSFNKKGEIELRGILELKGKKSPDLFHTVYIIRGGKRLITQTYEEGLYIKEVNHLETEHVIMNVNKNMPKTNF